MLKKILFLTCLISWETTAREAAPAPRVFPGNVGLVLIASAHDGFAMATDGASANADGTISEAQKLFPVGKNGGMAVAGTVSIQDPVNRPVREEVNVARIASAWLEAHPDVAVDTAGKEISALVVQATTKYFSSRAPGAAMGRYKFALIFAGFVGGKPVLNATRYYMPLGKGKPMRAEALAGDAKPGAMWIFGQANAEQELINGKSNALKSFKAEPSTGKFHSSPSKDLSAQDLASLFDTVLRASESREGKKLVAGKPAVAPPNKLAIITSKDGFAWNRGQEGH